MSGCSRDIARAAGDESAWRLGLGEVCRRMDSESQHRACREKVWLYFGPHCAYGSRLVCMDSCECRVVFAEYWSCGWGMGDRDRARHSYAGCCWLGVQEQCG